MSLSTYLENLVNKGLLEVEAAQILNERYATEEDQKNKAEHYLEEKKALLAHLKSGVSEDELKLEHRHVQIHVPRPYSYLYYTPEEYLEWLGESLQKMMDSIVCPWCSERYTVNADHETCRELWKNLFISVQVRRHLASGELGPEYVEKCEELERRMTKAGEELDRKRAAKGRPKIQGDYKDYLGRFGHN